MLDDAMHAEIIRRLPGDAERLRFIERVVDEADGRADEHAMLVASSRSSASASAHSQ